MMRRVLVANRGEIALRVIRACRELGLETVAVYSAADAAAPHVDAADASVPIGPPPPTESYLAIERILDAARKTRADAIHPGYGFLAEQPAFAQACADAGIVFVGPPAAVLARMGSKIEARRLVAAAGVPVVPGDTPTDQSDAGIAAAARRVGVPALLKASAGGGGKGMRAVHRDDELPEAIAAARREALAAFGDGTLYVERLLERPRHIEVQILADRYGRVVHLGERDCSIQRRFQKIVEESPSPAVTPTLRTRLGEAALAVARAAHYENAGTVEFLVDGEGDDARFYFLEMNTRLQVEHPVTEAVSGVDLVQAQLSLAAGEPLPWRQEDLELRGHAVECRIYAEDPWHAFLPQAGTILRYQEPAGPGLRIDAGIVEGSPVPIYYDPLLAKLVAHAESRMKAIRRATTALADYVILGVRTNLPYLLRVLAHPRFVSGQIDTRFVDEVHADLIGEPPPHLVAAAIAAATADAVAGAPASAAPTAPPTRARDPWETLRGWRT